MLQEARTRAEAAFTQPLSRWTVREMIKFSHQAGPISLCGMVPMDSVPRDLHFLRTGGDIGSLMDLIRHDTSKAIRASHERLNEGLLDTIRLNEGPSGSVCLHRSA